MRGGGGSLHLFAGKMQVACDAAVDDGRGAKRPGYIGHARGHKIQRASTASTHQVGQAGSKPGHAGKSINLRHPCRQLRQLGRVG